jgi:hypothetical protein
MPKENQNSQGSKKKPVATQAISLLEKEVKMHCICNSIHLNRVTQIVYRPKKKRAWRKETEQLLLQVHPP